MRINASPWGDRIAVGIAYSGYTLEFLSGDPERVDYVEIPYELLRHDPSVARVGRLRPMVLHCATLSVGGSVPCDACEIREIRRWAQRTNTPWIGEHLAFVTANRQDAGPHPEPYAPNEPYNIGYTVSPPMNDASLDIVVDNLGRCQRQIGTPLLIENSPLYFPIPTSTFTQSEFISAVCQRSPVGLLLDLAHLYITSRTMGFDPLAELEKWPLDRVVEIHVSGVQHDAEGVWDDHASDAPDIVYQMLERCLVQARPRAITLEFNWSAQFPHELLLSQLKRTRAIVDRPRAVGAAAR